MNIGKCFASLAFAGLVAVGCASAPNGDASDDRVSSAEGALGLCPGRPPPPRVCERVVCVAGDAAWDYQALAKGTTCQSTGHCNGQGTCEMPPNPATCSTIDPTCALYPASLPPAMEAKRVELGCDPVFYWSTGGNAGLLGAYMTRCPDTPAFHANFNRGWTWTFCDACIPSAGYGYYYVSWIDDLGPNCPSSCRTVPPPGEI